jgi:hypothetical protein
VRLSVPVIYFGYCAWFHSDLPWNYKVLTPEEYLKSFPIKAEVVGQPTFVAANVVITALKTNCIAMDDDRSALGKLHCMMDSSSMEANKTKILTTLTSKMLCHTTRY